MKTYRQENQPISRYPEKEHIYRLTDNPTYNQQIPHWYREGETELDEHKYCVYKNERLIGKRKDMKEAVELYESIIPKKQAKSGDLDKRLYDVEFFVEATSQERFYLWCQNEDYKKSEDKQDNHLKWESDSSGVGYQVGMVKVKKEKFPVVVTFTFATIEGTLVCFYECNSRCVDWTQIEEFLEDYFPLKYDNGTRRAKTNCSNFHHCVGFVEARKKEREKSELVEQ